MSIKVMTQVWESDLPAEQKYVLLKLADHADDDGSHVYPSIRLVSEHTGLSERTVQRRVRELLADGVLEVTATASHHKPTEYRVRGDRLTPLTENRGDKSGHSGVTNEASGVTPGDSGVTKTAFRGDTGDTQTVKNRQEEPSSESSREASGRAARRDAIPPEIPDEFIDELRERYPGVDLDYELRKWRDHVAVKPPKGNWKNSLRNWIERAQSVPVGTTAKADDDAEWLQRRYERTAAAS